MSQPQYRLEIDAKMAALKVSPSIVSLVYFSGELVLSQASGTIIETEQNYNIVITSLHLIRRSTDAEAEFVENSLADNLKIVIRASDENSYVGKIHIFYFHYNILIIKLKSMAPLPCANLRMIDDDLIPEKSSLRPHGFKLKTGDPVAVVGKYFYKDYDFMAASSYFRMKRCEPAEYDCREGASPSFYGFEGSNVYVANIDILERLMKKFGISNGLLVEKVLPGSHAESAGLREDDVILKCDGKAVKGFFELWDLMWEKVGQTVDLEVGRVNLDALQTLTMVVGEASSNELNNVLILGTPAIAQNSRVTKDQWPRAGFGLPLGCARDTRPCPVPRIGSTRQGSLLFGPGPAPIVYVWAFEWVQSGWALIVWPNIGSSRPTFLGSSCPSSHFVCLGGTTHMMIDETLFSVHV
ncbi:hypothetical protein KSS87_014311 [Heliosperma pusillum]|nr:hypothetical protein KSS87_014311 [Heliosperma pusillum]